MSERVRRSALALLLVGVLLWPAAARAQADDGPKAAMAHWVLSRDQGGLDVFQMWQIGGGAGAAELVLPLPAGHTGLTVIQGPPANAVEVRPDALVDKAGVAPGDEKTLAFRFSLPLADGANLFSQRLGLPADLLLVLVDAGVSAIPVGGTALQNEGAVTMGERTFQQWSRSGAASGDALSLMVQPAAGTGAAGAPGAGSAGPAAGGEPRLLNQSFHGGNANVMLWQRMTGSPDHNGMAGILLMLAGLAVLVVAGVIIGRHWRRAGQAAAHAAAAGPAGQAAAVGSAGPARPEPEPPGAALLARRNRLANAIAALDQQLAAGEVAAGEHARRRAELKRELVQVMARLEEVPAGRA